MLYENMIVDGIYQIIREIGRGGMGIVYLAYHLRLEKYIVLKKIKNPYADISMLRNEVDILKSIHHSYLPQVYDFIDIDGDLFTVIDYIDGYDLNYYIENGYVFQEGQLIKWLRQLCEVLQYLHAQNPKILHTDIKPGNIIITTNGDVCLIDFGISLYNTDVIKGLSEYYSSPEQYCNFQHLKYGTEEYYNLDERTDIYSLGATFFHVITGIRPDVKNYEQLNLSQYLTGYSESFTKIIDKSLEYDINRRFRNADDIIKAIDNMKKSDVRYKKYVLAQIISSVLSVMLIVFGVLMVICGYNNEIMTAYEDAYNSFVSLSDLGDYQEAAKAGQNILNNNYYSKFIDNKSKSLIMHRVGDMYYESEDYYSAVYYYELALKYDVNDIYYRDYALALIGDNQIDKAQSVLNDISRLYPDSAAIILTEARLLCNNKKYSEAVLLIDSKKDIFSDNIDNLYIANYIKGTALEACGRYDLAAQSFESAMSAKETVAVLRKAGLSNIKYAQNSNSNIAYKKALDCFDNIYENYYADTDDIINLGQTVLLLNDTSKYEKCKRIYSEYLEKGKDCRIYILISIFADATDDPKAEQYCDNARKCYDNLSDDDKKLISSESMNEIKRIYKKYCGQDWQVY